MESEKLSTKEKLRGAMIVLIIMLVLTLVAFGCAKKPATIIVNGVEVAAPDIPEAIELEKYTFNGHDYVGHYYGPFATTASQSNFLVHDPDCRSCNQKKEQ